MITGGVAVAVACWDSLNGSEPVWGDSVIEAGVMSPGRTSTRHFAYWPFGAKPPRSHTMFNDDNDALSNATPDVENFPVAWS